MKKPFLTLAQAKEIRETYPTPFHIYDQAGIEDNAKKLYQAFSWNPGFKEYFAVTATPSPGLWRGLLLSHRAYDGRAVRLYRP